MKKDQFFFEQLYSEWKFKLRSKKGKYFGIINVELERRLKKMKFAYNEGTSEFEFEYQVKFLYVVAFFIYYKVHYFFDGEPNKCKNLKHYDEVIVVNIYSFVHVLFRHYFPGLSIKNDDRSLNKEINFLNINYFPEAIVEFLGKLLLKLKQPLNPKREYILFSYKGDKYVIWLKYKSLIEMGGEMGFHFRTLYRVEQENDLQLFKFKKQLLINKDVKIFV